MSDLQEKQLNIAEFTIEKLRKSLDEKPLGKEAAYEICEEITKLDKMVNFAIPTYARVDNLLTNPQKMMELNNEILELATKVKETGYNTDKWFEELSSTENKVYLSMNDDENLDIVDALSKHGIFFESVEEGFGALVSPSAVLDVANKYSKMDEYEKEAYQSLVHKILTSNAFYSLTRKQQQKAVEINSEEPLDPCFKNKYRAITFDDFEANANYHRERRDAVALFLHYNPTVCTKDIGRFMQCEDFNVRKHFVESAYYVYHADKEALLAVASNEKNTKIKAALAQTVSHVLEDCGSFEGGRNAYDFKKVKELVEVLDTLSHDEDKSIANSTQYFTEHFVESMEKKYEDALSQMLPETIMSRCSEPERVNYMIRNWNKMDFDTLVRHFADNSPAVRAASVSAFITKTHLCVFGQSNGLSDAWDVDKVESTLKALAIDPSSEVRKSVATTIQKVCNWCQIESPSELNKQERELAKVLRDTLGTLSKDEDFRVREAAKEATDSLYQSGYLVKKREVELDR